MYQIKGLVYQIVSLIPKGKVLTYQKIADLIKIDSARPIGNILHSNQDPRNIPCHRVVSSSGRLAKNYAFGGLRIQKEKLLSESAQFMDDDRVNLVASLWHPTELTLLYLELLEQFGDPGPWPWFNTDSPHTPEEIAIGAILTQNTSWQNAQKSINNLRLAKTNSFLKINYLYQKNPELLKSYIKPSGYYNQKARYLYNFSTFTTEYNFDCLSQKSITDARKVLLQVKGVGKETADTILLYCLNKPIFVVDSYTKQFTKKLSVCRHMDYDNLQKFYEHHLPSNIKLFQNFHALIIKFCQTPLLEKVQTNCKIDKKEKRWNRQKVLVGKKPNR
ncbi:MAG: methylated-DNA--[protein]-cysteine S-methyltransferase [bacterium]|nr:methylated-DNA--[protein]-cysteine S-methyltransferase [bacterium]